MFKEWSGLGNYNTLLIVDLQWDANSDLLHPSILEMTSILDDSAPHDLHPMPTINASAGSSVPYLWQNEK